MAHAQRFFVPFLNTYVAFRFIAAKFFADTSVLPIRARCLQFRELPFLLVAHPISERSEPQWLPLRFGFALCLLHSARLNHQNSILGIEIDDSVEVLMIDRFVCSFDEQHYWMLIHFASIECLTNQGTRQPALQAKPCSVL